MVLIPRNSRPVLAGFLAVFLFLSPSTALRMLATERFVGLLTVQGEWIRARLGLARRTPPLPIELTRPLVIRKSDDVKAQAPFDRGAVLFDDAPARAVLRSAVAKPHSATRPPDIPRFDPRHRRAPRPDPLASA